LTVTRRIGHGRPLESSAARTRRAPRGTLRRAIRDSSSTEANDHASGIARSTRERWKLKNVARSALAGTGPRGAHRKPKSPMYQPFRPAASALA